jgi:hypothetical protein
MNNALLPLITLTQVATDSGPGSRLVFVNPGTITHFHEYHVWQFEEKPRGTRIHLTNGEAICVAEEPEQLAAFLSGIAPRDIATVGEIMPTPNGDRHVEGREP